ncbi:MAG: TIM barrel protein [Actinobacteria bacterium]|nr:TIM barrel protein [Actinomycetota bacterium]
MKAAVMDVVIEGRDDAEVFARAKRAGFAGVEVVVSRDDLAGSPAGGRLERLRRAKAAAGLEIPALVLGEHNEVGGIADTSPEAASRARADVQHAIGWARELGTDVILIPFFMRSELVSEADDDRAVAAFRALCPEAAEQGVSLCFEGSLPAERIVSLASRVGSKAFGCYFDLANPLAHKGLDGPTEIRALGELIMRVHVKDTRVRIGDCRPGTGRVDFAESALALSEIGYDGWLTLETPPAPPPLVSRDLSFTRSVFSGLDRVPQWPRLGAFSTQFGEGEWELLADAFAGLGLESVLLMGPLLDGCLGDVGRAEAGRARLEERGIGVAALGGYRNLVASDPAIRRKNIEHLRRCLEIAPAFGSFVVATETGTLSPDGDWTDTPKNSTEEAWRFLSDALETLLPVAEEQGVILAVETYVGNVLKTQGQLTGLLGRFPTQHLQVVCDPYNYLSRGLIPVQERATSELLDRFEPRFVLAHLKDVSPEGAHVATPEFGTGAFSQRPYLEFLRARRPDLDLIAEHMPLEHVPAVRRRLEELLTPVESREASSVS